MPAPRRDARTIRTLEPPRSELPVRRAEKVHKIGCYTDDPPAPEAACRF
ncbi:hypothetical protein [Phenylobacterium sp. SCN 70-31]|nr:hypothetical protein [Phenylobacterium sp. SCN 70-31]